MREKLTAIVESMLTLIGGDRPTVNLRHAMSVPGPDGSRLPLRDARGKDVPALGDVLIRSDAFMRLCSRDAQDWVVPGDKGRNARNRAWMAIADTLRQQLGEGYIVRARDGRAADGSRIKGKLANGDIDFFVGRRGPGLAPEWTL